MLLNYTTTSSRIYLGYDSCGSYDSPYSRPSRGQRPTEKQRMKTDNTEAFSLSCYLDTEAEDQQILNATVWLEDSILGPLTLSKPSSLDSMSLEDGLNEIAELAVMTPDTSFLLGVCGFITRDGDTLRRLRMQFEELPPNVVVVLVDLDSGSIKRQGHKVEDWTNAEKLPRVIRRHAIMFPTGTDLLDEGNAGTQELIAGLVYDVTNALYPATV